MYGTGTSKLKPTVFYTFSRSRTPEGEVDLELSLLVPASQCGALIGKEGAKIKEMR